MTSQQKTPPQASPQPPPPSGSLLSGDKLLDEQSIVEGALARPINISLKDSVSNQRMLRFEGCVSVTAFMLNSLVYMAGQGTWFHGVTMLASGTSFMTCAAERYLNGPPQNYQAQLAASAIWMMSSLQLFYKYKKMKWTGFSSWSGFALLSGYGFAEMIRAMTE